MRTSGAPRVRRRFGIALAAAVALALALRWWAGPPTPEGAGPRLILLIVVDTLRADHLGCYGYSRATSPRLDAWSERGILFERTWGTASWTMPSMASIWTGTVPARHGAGRRNSEESDFLGLATESITLVEALAASGRQTMGIVTNRFLHPSYGFARGFSEWDYDSGKVSRDRRASVAVDHALAWLDRWDGRPAFLLLHILDPHMPYDPPEATRGRFSDRHDEAAATLPLLSAREVRKRLDRVGPAELRELVAAYDEEIASVDLELDRLLRDLETRGLLGDSLVILTSDHGEELLEHGGFEHGHAQFEEVLRVPLVIWSPGLTPGRRAFPASVVDLFPTLLAAAGLEPPPDLDGVSLWPALTDPDAVRRRAIVAQANLYGDLKQESVIAWPWKRIALPGAQAALLFDLARDPGERVDLATRRPQDAARLADLLLEFRPRSGAGPAPPERALDEETQEELRALGYL